MIKVLVSSIYGPVPIEVVSFSNFVISFMISNVLVYNAFQNKRRRRVAGSVRNVTT